jgi:tetratricopeptide (TPR) repeat protein
MEAHMTLRQRISHGMLAWEADDFEEALTTFEAVLAENPNFPDINNKAGLCKAMLGDSEGALHSFDKAIELAPTYAEAHVNRGIVLNELGRHDEARKAFEESARLDTRDGKAFPSQVGNQIAVTHAKLGDLYMVAQRPADAAEQFRKALEVRPRFMDIRAKLGEALLDMGAVDQARDEFQRVLEDNDDFWNARLKLGVALQRLGDVDGAIREWERVAEQVPHDMRPKAYIAGVRGEA